MKESSAARKVEIITACAKYCDRLTGKLEYGALKILQDMFKPISERTIQRYWFEMNVHGAAVLITNKKAGIVGRGSKLTDEVRLQYTEIAQEYATDWIRLTESLLREELNNRGFHFSTSTVHEHLKLLKAHHVNLRLKPTLTPMQRESRVKFVLSKADRQHGINRAEHYYSDPIDEVHIDESWFFLQTVDNQVLVFDGVIVPHAPTVRHKSHIVKVMFIVALAKPGRQFDGKIGLWPCVSKTSMS